MQNTPLLNQFSENINWNAFAYITSKVCSVALSFLLYKTISTQDFSIWANSQSIIFLILLWVDGGFRKSIPRYISSFSTTAPSYYSFIYNLVLFRLGTICCALPFFYIITSSLLKNLSQGAGSIAQLTFIICAIFCVEGIVSLLRIFFHSHFLSKQFSSVYATMVTIEVLADIIFISFISNSPQLITMILGMKLASGVGTMIITGTRFCAIMKSKVYPETGTLDITIYKKQFITHSALMWASNSIKSLSERNFLLPLLTFTLGPGPANMYKLANDGALLLYRSVFKTIGSTDTVLLSTINTNDQDNNHRILFFEQITKTLINLCAIALTIGFWATMFSKKRALESALIPIFSLLLMSYIIEILLSPYERILEVDRHYKTLFYSYIPYLCVMIIILTTSITGHLGLFNTIALICAIRLVCASLMAIFVQKKYLSLFQFPAAHAWHFGKYFILINGSLFFVFTCLTR